MLNPRRPLARLLFAIALLAPALVRSENRYLDASPENRAATQAQLDREAAERRTYILAGAIVLAGLAIGTGLALSRRRAGTIEKG